MERFVRGDASRSTDGSGLGLSIAQNLCELQGAKLELSISGDLFTAKVKFQKA
jgi:signal transduction histidine kinase